jgi:hypothetical protein
VCCFADMDPHMPPRKKRRGGGFTTMFCSLQCQIGCS